jgi:hypothetical protein
MRQYRQDQGNDRHRSEEVSTINFSSHSGNVQALGMPKRRREDESNVPCVRTHYGESFQRTIHSSAEQDEMKLR